MTSHSNSSTCSLQAPAIVALLSKLHAESDASDAKAREVFGNVTPEERRQHMSDPNADYRGFYSRAHELYLAVSPETARLLYTLARGSGARSVVEFGTSFGISTIHLAAALRDNGGGRLIGSELLASKAAQARANLSAAGLADLVDVREGDALETLSRDLPDRIDFVLLDGHKALYPRILELLLPRLRVGAYIVADNAEAAPTYLERVRTSGGGFYSVPFGPEVELSVKL
jgi:predicted O-methyltransferase YrrM